MDTIVTVVHFITAFLIVGLILLQQGKGAEMGASFGGGGSNTVFGSTGGGSFFGKLTAVLAFVFFVTSLSLALFARNDASINLSEQIPFLDTVDAAPADVIEINEPVMPTDELEFQEISAPEGSDLSADDVESPALEMPAE